MVASIMVRTASVVIALFLYVSPQSANAAKTRSKQPIIVHQKMRHSALLLQKGLARHAREEAQGAAEPRPRPQTALLQTPQNQAADGTELLQQLAQATPTTVAELAVSAKTVLANVKKVHKETKEVMHNSHTERDMLETQLLANGESLHLINKLADTVAKMKAEVMSLETHERLCRKKLADLKGAETQRTADTIAANTVQAAD